MVTAVQARVLAARDIRPFCRGLCFPDRAVKSKQIRLFRKLLAGCSFTVGVVTSCWKVASLELAFASVAGRRSRMTAHLRRSGTRPRSPAAGYGRGIVIRERPLRRVAGGDLTRPPPQIRT